MDKRLGTLLRFWGVFQFIQVQLLPSPHKQCWTRVSRTFSEFPLCIGWGKGELQKDFENNALFLGGTEKRQNSMNAAVLSKGLLSRIVECIEDQLDQQKSCLSVSFTACRTSLILQQYSNGFKDELK